ncbi:hypothetical protein M9458_052729, partial [Cirrhinus mrigala]
AAGRRGEGVRPLSPSHSSSVLLSTDRLERGASSPPPAFPRPRPAQGRRLVGAGTGGPPPRLPVGLTRCPRDGGAPDSGAGGRRRGGRPGGSGARLPPPPPAQPGGSGRRRAPERVFRARSSQRATSAQA